jgi:hypothetical protein
MLITWNNFAGFDCNKYEPVFRCECGYDELYMSYGFCPICGTALEFDSKIESDIRQSEDIPHDYFRE